LTTTKKKRNVGFFGEIRSYKGGLSDKGKELVLKKRWERGFITTEVGRFLMGVLQRGGRCLGGRGKVLEAEDFGDGDYYLNRFYIYADRIYLRAKLSKESDRNTSSPLTPIYHQDN